MLKELKKRMRIELVDLCVESPEMLRFLTYFDESMLNSREELEAMLSKVYGTGIFKNIRQKILFTRDYPPGARLYL